jgi:iron complex transport system substrate-binding protein
MNIKMYTKLILPFACLAFVAPAADRLRAEEAKPETAYRTITDMAGRTVRIPAKITKVLSIAPPPTTFVYMLAPEMLGGWLGSSPKGNQKFIPKELHDRPVFQWGRGSTNYEAYIAARPDFVFVGNESGADISRIAETQEKFGTIPVVCVNNTRNALDYTTPLRFMGEVLGVPDRAEKLIAYYEGVLREVQAGVATIPAEKRVRVYYAEGSDGLSTDPAGSVHSQLIDVCGGINVAACSVNTGSGMTPVTLESILMWKPQIIITTNREFAKRAPADETWSKIEAVREHRIHVTPSHPYNWFDRPPGVNRIVGIPWVAHVLYPEKFTEDWFNGKVKQFYELFYHYTLTDGDIKELLGGE